MHFNFSTNIYAKNIALEIERKCNAVTFINTGNQLVLINGSIPLNAGLPGTNNGESITIGGNAGEILKGRIDIAFPNGPGQILVIQKFYL